MKKEIKYSIQHSDITEAEIKKEDIDEIVNKLPNLESESKIETLIEQEKKTKLSNEDIAKMVINGEYGNGEERKQRLEEEGRNFDEIQKEVEKILNIQKEQESAVTNQNSGKTMTMEATAYSTAQPGLSRYTANGTDLHTNPRVIAVDPSVIPLGTKVTVEGYGTYIAADTGGAIKGNRIDIHFSTVQECINFGRKNVKITIHN